MPENNEGTDVSVSSPQRPNSSQHVSEISTKRKVVSCLILLSINLLNYIDRYTIVGVMDKLIPYFRMSNSDSGMIQTVFIGTFMIFAPAFGYLGDRYNRKFLMMIGISIWICSVFMSSFCGEGHYYLFLFWRSVVGIGEASYSTIAPTIISDLFTGTSRSKVLMLFYFAIPFGCGLGFISGSQISYMTNSWEWGIRFSPIIGIPCLIAMFFFLEEPVRGQCEGAAQPSDNGGIWDDVKYLCSVKTYCLVTLGSVATFFVTGCMSWWTPTFIGLAAAKIAHKPKMQDDDLAYINMIFGLITCVGGLVGVCTGSMMSRWWRSGTGPCQNRPSERADTYICAISMLLALPFLFFAIYVASYSVNICLGLIAVGIVSMCLNWAVIVDILMYVVVANRRATAMAGQTLIAHLFGDASSPYIIGLISDSLRGNETTIPAQFTSLQYSLYIPTFMLVVATAFYLAATFYVEEDRHEAAFQMNAEIADQIDADEDEGSLINNRRQEGGVENEGMMA